MHNPPSTASAAQIEANRRNAQHGRGPNTARGKFHSSQNAIRHGLAGRIVVLPTEDMAAYKVFSKENSSRLASTRKHPWNGNSPKRSPTVSGA